MAAIFLKQAGFLDCIKTCDEALEIDPASVKALFRKGSACIHYGRWEDADRNLQLALKADPTNVGAKRELRRLRELQAKQNRKEKQKFSGMFK